MARQKTWDQPVEKGLNADLFSENCGLSPHRSVRNSTHEYGVNTAAFWRVSARWTTRDVKVPVQCSNDNIIEIRGFLQIPKLLSNYSNFSPGLEAI
jgi:hypothetical protein